MCYVFEENQKDGISSSSRGGVVVVVVVVVVGVVAVVVVVVVVITLKWKLSILKNNRQVGERGEKGVDLVSLYNTKYANEWYSQWHLPEGKTSSLLYPLVFP